MQRETALAALRDAQDPFEVLVIGGGASGLGAAVDAAARGYRVALIEQGDFAQGTSSRSTKLVHGGVRYLKQGNVSLVRSALHERELMRRNAPHLVRAQAFVIPSYTWWERPYYGIGLALYDVLAGRHSFGRSMRLSRAETLARLPTVEPQGLAGGVLYHDGQFDDARFAVALAWTAVEQGAVLVNYCQCAGLVKEGGRVAGALVRDRESGAEFVVRARVVINATGVFVDAVRHYDEPAAAPLLAVSQGIHVVLPRAFLPGETALMVPKTADGRVLFVIPWQDRVVVGTTDTPGITPTLEPRARPEEIAFVMEHARHYLARDPAESDVLSVFTGLRPLVRRGANASTAALSRDHTILVSPGGLVTLTGGKWTTYRKMAEDVVNAAEGVAGFAHRPSPTAGLSLHGAEEGAAGRGALGVYGRDAAGIQALARTAPELAEPLHAALPFLRAEVVWHVRHELARTVEDVLARRTRALVLDARASIAAAPLVARIMAAELGRDEAWVRAQIHDYTRLAGTWLLPSAPVTAPAGTP